METWRYGSTPAVITTEPVHQNGVQHQPGEKPPNTKLALVVSGFSAFFCCFVLGLVANFIARDAHLSAVEGKYAEARQKLKKAWIYIWATIVVGVILWIVLIVVIVIQVQRLNENSSLYKGYY